MMKLLDAPEVLLETPSESLALEELKLAADDSRFAMTRYMQMLAVLTLHAHTVTVQMSTPDECPYWPTLLAWLEGELPDQKMRWVGTHVPDCSVCRERLSLLDGVQRVVERQD